MEQASRTSLAYLFKDCTMKGIHNIGGVLYGINSSKFLPVKSYHEACENMKRLQANPSERKAVLSMKRKRATSTLAKKKSTEGASFQEEPLPESPRAKSPQSQSSHAQSHPPFTPSNSDSARPSLDLAPSSSVMPSVPCPKPTSFKILL